MSDSIFNDNKSKFHSNCIYFLGTKLSVINSIFKRNNGAFDYIDYHPPELLKSQSVVKFHNQNGGAILTLAKNIEIINCWFLNNSNRIGGAIYLRKNPNTLRMESQTLLIDNVIFEKNIAGETGVVALDCDIEYINGNISESIFLENFSYYGI